MAANLYGLRTISGTYNLLTLVHLEGGLCWGKQGQISTINLSGGPVSWGRRSPTYCRNDTARREKRVIKFQTTVMAYLLVGGGGPIDK